LIAQRVNEWLEKCKDVDFAAEMDSTGIAHASSTARLEAEAK
jgi:hypothetical protein